MENFEKEVLEVVRIEIGERQFIFEVLVNLCLLIGLGVVPSLLFANLVEMEEVVEYQEYGWFLVMLLVAVCLYGKKRLTEFEGFYEYDESEEKIWERSYELLGEDKIMKIMDEVRMGIKKS